MESGKKTRFCCQPVQGGPFLGKILVIDDDATLAHVMARLLSEAGHETHVVLALSDGLTTLKRLSFDLVYCDVQLHNECGLELLSSIQSLSNPPLVIMVTGYPSLDTAQQAIRDGAFDYLVKPITGEELLRSVGRALSVQAFQQEKEYFRLHLEAVLDSVEEGLISISPDFVLISLNQAAERLCGVSQADLHRSIATHEALLERCQGQCFKTLRQAFQEGEKVSVPRLVCRRKGVMDRVVTLTAAPLRDKSGVMLGAVMAIKDETRLDLLEKALQQRPRFHRLVGQSASMQDLYRLIENLAELETTVLITGESGTGKELVAEAIHREGNRSAQPFVRVNCVALSETLLESELFGHVRGAFTGAVRDRIGRFQEANQGTLFLDEIGDISPAMQLRLLRFLQEKQFERVGDNRTQSVDVRIIAATNRDLKTGIAQGSFRQDLYYRLNVVEISIPPLRDRKEDISLLVDHTIADFNLRFGRQVSGITEETLEVMMHYHWPGNVRELVHVIEHAFVLCRDSLIAPSHLPAFLRPDAIPSSLPSPQPASGDPEKALILRALFDNRWNRDKAAQQLGMSRSTFYRRLKQLNISQSEVV